MKKHIFSLFSSFLLFVLIAFKVNAQPPKKDNNDITIDGNRDIGMTCKGNLTTVTINVGVKYTSKDNNYHIELSKINKGTKTDTTRTIKNPPIPINKDASEDAKKIINKTDDARVLKLTGVKTYDKGTHLFDSLMPIIKDSLTHRKSVKDVGKIVSITIQTTWIFKNTTAATLVPASGKLIVTKDIISKFEKAYIVNFENPTPQEIIPFKNEIDNLTIAWNEHDTITKNETVKRKQVKSSIKAENDVDFTDVTINNEKKAREKFSLNVKEGDEIIKDTTIVVQTTWNSTSTITDVKKNIQDEIHVLKKPRDIASFDMKGPLNFLVLDEIFREKSKEVLDNDCPLSNASIHEVFLYLYSITNETPTIGTLKINSSICVLTNDDEDREISKNYVLRNEVLVAYEDTLKSYEKTKSSYAIDKKRLYDGIAGDMSAGSYVSKIKEVSLQFERGFLERIQVWAENKNGKLVIYENIFAIGFSSVKNIRDFQNVKLFSRESNRDFQKFILLSDVFSNYDNLLDNYTRDYSPADTVLNKISSGELVVLKKETFFNLFDSKIFSDLSGMEEESPNGLVQIEASRRFNLVTSRHQFGNNIRADYGFFNYVNIYGSFNKIEKDSKYLTLQNQGVSRNGLLVSPSYATNLDFRRYENASLGIEWGIFLWDWPDGKFTTYIDFGLKYGHTPLKDSSRTYVKADNIFKSTNDLIDLDGHTLTLYPRISTEFFAEKRVGLLIGYQFNNAFLFSNNLFKQIKSYAKSDLVSLPIEKGARQYHMLEFFLRAQASKEGKMFLRARFFFQQGDANTFFPQFQLGYAYNIFFRK